MAMTAKEKREREKVRKQLREKGLLPPRKKPINMRKFIDNAHEEFERELVDKCATLNFLYLALGIMHGRSRVRATREDVGIAKLIRVACEMKRMSVEQLDGDRRFSLDALYDRIQPILDE